LAVNQRPRGRIVNSAGDTDKDAWGKQAVWCDYHGPVEGETLGVAILNHPQFRAPTRWHVRVYGLFCVDPFAQHGFDPRCRRHDDDSSRPAPEPPSSLRLSHGRRTSRRNRRLYEDYARSKPLGETQAR